MPSINDDDDFDTDDEEFTQEVIRDKTTRESFLSLIGSASEGVDLIQFINLLLIHHNNMNICLQWMRLSRY